MNGVVRKARLRLKGFPNGIVALHRALVALGYEAKLVQRNIQVITTLACPLPPVGYKNEQTQVAIRLGSELFSFSSGTVDNWEPILVDVRARFFTGVDNFDEAYFTTEEKPFLVDPQQPKTAAGMINKIMDAIEARQAFEEQLKKKPARWGTILADAVSTPSGSKQVDCDSDGLFDIIEQYRQTQGSGNPNLKPLLVTLLHFLTEGSSPARLLKRVIHCQSEQGILNGERIAIEYGDPNRLVCLNARNGWSGLTDEERVKHGEDVTPFIGTVESAEHYLNGVAPLDPALGPHAPLFALLEKKLLEQTTPATHSIRPRLTL